MKGVKVDGHDGEAGPLHPNLCDAQETSKAGKAIDVMAASHVCPARGEDEDVREGACP